MMVESGWYFCGMVVIKCICHCRVTLSLGLAVIFLTDMLAGRIRLMNGNVFIAYQGEDHCEAEYGGKVESATPVIDDQRC